MNIKPVKYFWRSFEYIAFGLLIYKIIGFRNGYMERYLSLYELFLVIGICSTIFTIICLSAKPQSANLKKLETYFKKRHLFNKIDALITFGMGLVVWIFLGNKSLAIFLIMEPLISWHLKKTCKIILDKQKSTPMGNMGD